MSPTVRRITQVGLLALLWGSNFLLIKIAVRGLSPYSVAFLRLAAGAAVLLIWIRFQRQALPRGRQAWTHLSIAGLLGTALPYTFFAIGEQSVSSGLAGALNATTPLWTLLAVAVIQPSAGITGQQISGLLAGFVGAILILSPWTTHESSITGALICLTAAASYGLAYAYIARWVTPLGGSSATLAAAQLLSSAALTAIPSGVSLPHSPPLRPEAITAVVVLGFVGTGLAYVLFYAIIAEQGATAAAAVTYLLPVVALVLGMLLLGERARATTWLGVAMVLVGVGLTQRRPSLPRATEVAK